MRGHNFTKHLMPNPAWMELLPTAAKCFFVFLLINPFNNFLPVSKSVTDSPLWPDSCDIYVRRNNNTQSHAPPKRIKSFTICTFLHWAATWNENCSTFIHWIWGFSSLFQKPVVKIGILVPKAKAILSWIFWATLFNLDILNDFLELDRDKMAFQSSNTTYYKGHKTLPISVKQLVYISIRQCATRL